MLKVVDKIAAEDKWMDVIDMPVGSLGVTKDGLYYFRTMVTATCLNKVGDTYSHLVDGRKHCLVRLMSNGFRLTLEVCNNEEENDE